MKKKPRGSSLLSKLILKYNFKRTLNGVASFMGTTPRRNGLLNQNYSTIKVGQGSPRNLHKQHRPLPLLNNMVRLHCWRPQTLAGGHKEINLKGVWKRSPCPLVFIMLGDIKAPSLPAAMPPLARCDL